MKWDKEIYSIFFCLIFAYVTFITYICFMEKTLEIRDINNKLSPITTLLGLLDDLKENDWEINPVDSKLIKGFLEGAISESKKSVNYLSDREIYK